MISNIIGGLGNQMFQYAAGRALSIARNCSLRLDVSGFSAYGIHQGFELDRVFSCPVTLAKPVDVQSILGWQSSRPLRRILARPIMSVLRSPNFVVEPHFHYWSGIRDVPLSSYLTGYWQSERYFADVAEVIREGFTFRQPLIDLNLELAREISSANAVSLHVRRGDFANNPKALATHGVCPVAYYEAAIKLIAERIDAPQFFIFSDDIAWIRANLNINYPCRYVDHNRGMESYNDMRLMSLCRHHILANSSFSWWGAWLNPRAEKIVVAPAHWFAGKERRMDDLFPHGWMTL